ncbi:hypothetical protein C8J57DRAFT_1223698 [Mycena rebaudengoi]|nr:hypothetical protein C8J57DRAFT_1223698 [Mycena rebaudengoi]
MPHIPSYPRIFFLLKAVLDKYFTSATTEREVDMNGFGQTAPLPPPHAIAPDLPPNMPAYLAACPGVSNATLGKILPPVMSARGEKLPDPWHQFSICTNTQCRAHINIVVGSARGNYQLPKMREISRRAEDPPQFVDSLPLPVPNAILAIRTVPADQTGCEALASFNLEPSSLILSFRMSDSGWCKVDDELGSRRSVSSNAEDCLAETSKSLAGREGCYERPELGRNIGDGGRLGFNGFGSRSMDIISTKPITWTTGILAVCERVTATNPDCGCCPENNCDLHHWHPWHYARVTAASCTFNIREEED